MKKILIVTDLDGTLLNNRHEVSSMNEKWIKEFKLNGGLFTIATGRMDKSMLPFINQLEVELPVISYNGARVSSPITNEVIYEQELLIPTELWEILHEYQQDAGIFIYQNGLPFIFERNEIVEAFEEKEKVKCIIGDLKDFLSPVTKVLIILEASGKLKELENIIKLSGFMCETVFSEKNYLEILPFGTSKGKGLNKLKEHLGLSNTLTIAFGDNLNDVSLLKAADIGIVVENAHPDLKEISDIVAIHNNEEDAIAHVIIELLKNGEFKESLERFVKSSSLKNKFI